MLFLYTYSHFSDFSVESEADRNSSRFVWAGILEILFLLFACFVSQTGSHIAQASPGLTHCVGQAALGLIVSLSSFLSTRMVGLDCHT